MCFSNTNLNLYRSFVAVYETRSIHKAANLLTITHSAVGKNIRELAHQIGKPLFITSKLGTEPTSDSIEMYQRIKYALALIKNSEESINDFNEQSFGLIRLGCPSHFTSFVFKDYFCQFNKKYPNIRLEFFSSSNNESISLLEKKNIDFIIDTPTIINEYNFETIKLLSLNNVFFVSNTFLKQRNLNTKISKEELSQLPFVIQKRHLRSLSAELKIQFNPIAETVSAESVHSLVLCNMGIGYCIENLIDNNLVSKIEIKDVALKKVDLIFAYNNNLLNKASKAFLDGLREYCKNLVYNDL